ncbi:MAG: histidine phosphatase family protein, partial [Desulfuromonadales bacterium]|nr:histidine phosphatase family protein [Desulfuromonadales bacterium]
QSGWLADRLATAPLDQCFCSPLLRAQQTAFGIAENQGIEIETQTALREIDFGLWEGRTFAEIETDEPQNAQDWCRNPLEFSFPQGDSVSAFMQRLQTYLQWLKNCAGDHLLLVTHGGVIRILLTLLLQLDPKQQSMFGIDRGSLTTVKIYATTAILTGLNHGIK